MTEPKGPANDDVTQILSRPTGQMDRKALLESLRRNVCILFTDLKGSTSYFEKFGDAAGLLMVDRSTKMLSLCVERHKGRVIKTIGDSVMAFFEDPAEAIAAAVEMQEVIFADNKDKDETRRVSVRIGVNYGLGLVKSDDVFGDVVNVASRVESAALPEQIVISDSVKEQIDKLSLFKITHIGRFSLKGKEGDRDLYEVSWSDNMAVRLAAAHAAVAAPKAMRVVPKYKLQHIRKDGSMGQQHDLKNAKLSLGKSQGDLQFPSDPTLAPLHARFFVEDGQLFVEDLSEGKGVFVRLIATYTLQDGDAVLMGKQLLQFKEKSEAVAAAAATGTTVLDMSNMIKEPVALFFRLTAEGTDHNVRFPVVEQEITWGRTKGTYVFPDDGFMSRSHAKVYQRGENYFLEDVGSRNGTFIKVRGKTPVPVGAMVLAGGQLLKVAT